MFTPPDFETIRRAILRDTQSFFPDADISPDSEHFVHASRLAACAAGQYAHQAWIVRQIFPDTADSAYLERHAALRGINRRNATFADGRATVSGTVGASLPVGLTIKCGQRFYQTREAGTISSGGTVRLAIVATSSGSLNNLPASTAQLMAPPTGVLADCTIEAKGGADAESDVSLLSRLLAVIRRPPAGGNKYDYQNWALSVDGVASAYVYPLRRGPGTVDIAITSDQGAPSADTVAKVQAYIDEVRPVTAKNVQVLAPDETRVDVRVQVKTQGIGPTEARDRIQAALAAHFALLGVGQDVIVSQLETAISNVAGITDRKLMAPTANLQADVQHKIEWFVLGDVVVENIP